MEYIKRILFVVLLICLAILFFHFFLFICLVGIIAYIGYKVYLMVTKNKEPKEENIKINNVIIDAEYTEK